MLKGEGEVGGLSENSGGPGTYNEMMADENTQHLDLLGIFHYIAGGMAIVFSCFPVLHLVFGVALLTGRIGSDTGGPDGQVIGGFVAGFALLFILLGLTIAALVIAAGRFLRARRRYTFCLVVAGVECIFFPIGTVLGVFTIIVLQRPGVKELFGAAP